MTAITVTALASATLTGCGSSDPATDSIAIVDPWVKTVDEGMTAAFGEITNNSDGVLVLVSVATDASPTTELHETLPADDATAMMRQKEGGFVLEPGGTLSLEPGGDHIMLMDVTEPITPGDEVDFTLNFEDGTTFDFTAVAKEFAGANEEYEGDTGHHDHGAHGDGDH